MFEEYFKKLWFTGKESEIFKTLYLLGTKPASTIAKYLWYERTTVYKILQNLSRENLVFETHKGGIKHFFIPSIDVLKNYSEAKTQKFSKLSSEYETVKHELLDLWFQKDASIPKITIFDSPIGIKNMHNDILLSAVKNKYISIRLFASNTVDSQVTLSKDMKNSTKELFENLQKNKISIESFLWNGIMLMESISKTYNIDTISDLPASNSAVNIYLVGQVIYIIIFKDSPFGIKIESSDLANTFHFLFDKVEHTT